MKNCFILVTLTIVLAIPASADQLRPDIKIGVITNNNPIVSGLVVCVEELGVPAKLTAILEENIKVTSWTWYIQREKNQSSRETIAQGKNMSVLELTELEEATYLLKAMVNGKPYMTYVSIFKQGTVTPENSFEMFIRQTDGVIWSSKILKCYEATPIELKPWIDRKVPDCQVTEWAWYRNNEKFIKGSGRKIDPIKIQDNAKYQLIVCFEQ